MKQVAGLLLVLALYAATVLAADTRKEPPRRAAMTITGCLDQRDETYVLTGDRELKVKYTLQGEGFSNDNFARYLGHRVEVKGVSETGVFRVRTIRSLSESCTPRDEAQP